MLNYQTVDFLASQLEDQYNKQVASGLDPYPYQEQLPRFFRAQAAKLAANNVRSIYDVQQADGGIVNTATGEQIKDVVLRPTWETDPEAYKFRDPVELEERGGGKYTRWGKDLSVTGQGDYGLSFVDNKPVFTPYWKDTQNFSVEDAVKTAAAIAAIYYGGQYLLAPEAAGATAAYNPMAGAEFAFAPEAAASAPFFGDPFAGLETAAGQEALANLPPYYSSYYGDPFAGLETEAGQKALESTASSKGALDTLRTANAVKNMLTPPTVQQQAGLLSGGGGQARGVDFSPLYQNTMVGLLPLAERYRRSLI
jgi:hypothetical protein